MMDEKTINEMIEKLVRGELDEIYVEKKDFMSFRNVIVNRPDFKHFRGTALRGGDVIYEYMDEPRK